MAGAKRALPERVFIIGAPGSGKTTLALRLTHLVDLPLYHLDEIARVGGGDGPATSPEYRSANVSRILDSGTWIVEGIHLGWTDPLLEAADAIVWLDEGAWWRNGAQMVRRFVREALAEVSRQKGLRKFTRFRDYAGHLSALVKALAGARGFEARGVGTIDRPDRGMVAARLAPLAPKVVRTRSPRDIEAFVAQFKTTAR